MAATSRQVAHVLNLPRLRAFVAICEEGSLTRAAARLRIAQPALTTMIRKLESETGTSLLTRHPRGSIPTEKGRLLLRRAYDILGTADATLAELTTAYQEPEGEVAIGLPPSISTVLAVPLIRHVKATLPRVSLRVVEAFSGYLWDWLPDHTLDVVLCFDRESTERVVCQPLCTEEIFLVGRAALMPDDPAAISPERLIDYPMILPSGRHGIRTNAEKYAASAGGLQVRMQIDAGNQLVKLVAAGEGYSLMAQCAVLPELKASEVRTTPLSPPLRRAVVIGINRLKARSYAVSRVVEEISAISHELIRAGEWPAQPA